ncbi:hypothetical protein [Agrobacterium cavarae]|uniref:hypothetical protein n=1 Tax=Agrobacterium cavarae TaxID=2528239 RepID=UPI0028B1F3A3|nr:hypothetical protein [Agrobacterium cavarae]
MEQDSQSALVITYRGVDVSSITEFDFQEFRDEPLIWENRQLLVESEIKNKAKTTLDHLRRDLRKIKLFFSSLRKGRRNVFRKIEELTVKQHEKFSIFSKNSPDPHKDVRSYRRIMKSIGVNSSQLAPNPYSPRKPNAKPTVDPSVAKMVLNGAKKQAAIIRKREAERSAIANEGSKLAASISRVSEANYMVEFLTSAEHKRRKIAREFEAEFGPECIMLSKSNSWMVTRTRGIRGLMQWTYPSALDLLPFFAMMLVRTPVNPTPLSEASALATPFAPFPLNITPKQNQEFLYFYAAKIRGRNEDLDEPYIQSCITPTLGYSYPYQVFNFVKALTEPVRSGIILMIKKLRSAGHTVENSKELRRLETISNDLFVYLSANSGFQSLRTAVYDSSPQLKRGFKALGLTDSRTIFRKLQVRFGYEHSGGNIVEAQLFANHREPKTTSRYTRHERNIKAKLELFENIFGYSLVLIEAGAFSADHLRVLLKAQKLAPEEVDNLLQIENTTRWGNRCSSPKNPPKGFGIGTPPGQICQRQNCIDGCPNARWFADARPLVSAARERLQLKLEALSTSDTSGSSLKSRIELCDRLLAALNGVVA